MWKFLISNEKLNWNNEEIKIKFEFVESSVVGGIVQKLVQKF